MKSRGPEGEPEIEGEGGKERTGGGELVEVVEVVVKSTEPREGEGEGEGEGLRPFGSKGRGSVEGMGVGRRLLTSVVEVEVVDEVEDEFRGSIVGAEVAVIIEVSVVELGEGLGEEVEPIIVVLDDEPGYVEIPGAGPRRDIPNAEKAKRKKRDVLIIDLPRKV